MCLPEVFSFVKIYFIATRMVYFLFYTADNLLFPMPADVQCALPAVIEDIPK